jgi:hypothetical protein
MTSLVLPHRWRLHLHVLDQRTVSHSSKESGAISWLARAPCIFLNYRHTRRASIACVGMRVTELVRENSVDDAEQGA